MHYNEFSRKVKSTFSSSVRTVLSSALTVAGVVVITIRVQILQQSIPSFLLEGSAFTDVASAELNGGLFPLLSWFLLEQKWF